MSAKSKSPELAREKGRRLAARMLREVERVCAYEASIAGMLPYSLFAEWRYKGEPQDNIVLRYLRQAFKQGGAYGDSWGECVVGFCSVLSDHCGNVEAGGALRIELYQRATEGRINDGDAPTREQVQREKNHPGTSLH
jgi:hypothetical protein